MSFYYNYPQHPRHRGPMDRYYLKRLLTDRAAKLALILTLVGAIGVLVYNSNGAKAYRHAKQTNGHFRIFGIGI